MKFEYDGKTHNSSGSKIGHSTVMSNKLTTDFNAGKITKFHFKFIPRKEWEPTFKMALMRVSYTFAIILFVQEKGQEQPSKFKVRFPVNVFDNQKLPERQPADLSGVPGFIYVNQFPHYVPQPIFLFKEKRIKHIQNWLAIESPLNKEFQSGTSSPLNECTFSKPKEASPPYDPDNYYMINGEYLYTHMFSHKNPNFEDYKLLRHLVLGKDADQYLSSPVTKRLIKPQQ